MGRPAGRPLRAQADAAAGAGGGGRAGADDDRPHQGGQFLGGRHAPDDPEQRLFGRHDARVRGAKLTRRRTVACRRCERRAGPGTVSPMSNALPQLVADRYRLLSPLGQGGMGRVWKARDEVLHRDVAIKELVPPPGLTDEERREMRERSLREARAIARLNHVNVVRIFDVLRTDGDPWIVMEYVASKSLQDTARRGRPGPAGPGGRDRPRGARRAQARRTRRGVMHRDVKPGNVLLGEDGRVVLTDFGLATIPGDPNVTRTGMVLGSPAYISPERARDGTAGPEADLWSLGATLYAAVEGKSPYARPSAIAHPGRAGHRADAAAEERRPAQGRPQRACCARIRTSGSPPRWRSGCCAAPGASGRAASHCSTAYAGRGRTVRASRARRSCRRRARPSSADRPVSPPAGRRCDVRRDSAAPRPAADATPTAVVGSGADADPTALVPAEPTATIAGPAAAEADPTEKVAASGDTTGDGTMTYDDEPTAVDGSPVAPEQRKRSTPTSVMPPVGPAGRAAVRG